MTRHATEKPFRPGLTQILKPAVRGVLARGSNLSCTESDLPLSEGWPHHRCPARAARWGRCSGCRSEGRRTGIRVTIRASTAPWATIATPNKRFRVDMFGRFKLSADIRSRLQLKTCTRIVGRVGKSYTTFEIAIMFVREHRHLERSISSGI